MPGVQKYIDAEKQKVCVNFDYSLFVCIDLVLYLFFFFCMFHLMRYSFCWVQYLYGVCKCEMPFSCKLR